jgi:hypothetical protein
VASTWEKLYRCRGCPLCDSALLECRLLQVAGPTGSSLPENR